MREAPNKSGVVLAMISRVSVARNHQRRRQGQITLHFLSLGKCVLLLWAGGKTLKQARQWPCKMGRLGSRMKNRDGQAEMLVSTWVLEAGTFARGSGRRISEIY